MELFARKPRSKRNNQDHEEDVTSKPISAWIDLLLADQHYYIMTITSLNENDVILGRGSARDFIGNKRFHQLVDALREPYLQAKNKCKGRIAKQVVNKIHSSGGRFVRQVRKGRKEGDLLVNGLWEQVEEKVAIEKAQQALREQVLRRRPSEVGEGHAEAVAESILKEIGIGTEEETSGSSENKLPSVPLPDQADHIPNLFLLNGAVPDAWSPLPASPILGSVYLPTDSDTRRLLLQQSGFGLQQAITVRRLVLLGQANGFLPNSMVVPAVPTSIHLPQYMSQLSAKQVLRKHRIDEGTPIESGDSHETHVVDHEMNAEDSLQSEGLCEDEEVAAFLLSSIAVKDRPTLTYEQVARERASLTDEQRAAVLADTFGKMSIDQVGVVQPKKSRNDLDRESINFLVRMMRLELEKIPSDEKKALVEAQAKCRPDEFSNSRLERFLRCEGLNVELAAQRFVRYWQKRKEAFRDKFTMRMTLSEALKDDSVALELGFVNLLPSKDLSGRTLIFTSAHKHTRKGYTSDSLFRAIWYTIEVAAESDDSCSDVVHMAWTRHLTILDYDSKIQDRLPTHYQSVWPVRCVAMHSCCPSNILLRLVGPILYALADSWLRARVLIHDVPESEIVGVLSQYGIEKEMLPTEMGGTHELNAREWVAQRRAIEMGMDELS